MTSYGIKGDLDELVDTNIVVKKKAINIIENANLFFSEYGASILGSI